MATKRIDHIKCVFRKVDLMASFFVCILQRNFLDGMGGSVHIYTRCQGGSKIMQFNGNVKKKLNSGGFDFLSK